MRHNGWKIVILVTSALCTTIALADDAPVVDLTQAAQATSDVQSAPAATPLTSDQRLDRLDQQMTNLTNMNFPQQVSELQAQIAQLRGQLQEAQHNLQLLTEQQKTFYQDLDQRLTQLKAGNSGSTSVIATKPSTPASGEANAYQAAFNFLANKNYDKAASAFQAYLTDFPQGQYVDNAHYWLGEIYFSKKNNDKAASEFKTVIDQFPKSAKVADAKLKMALIHQQAGDVTLARAEFLKIKQQHPNSTAAQLANIQLQELGVPPAK